MIASKCAIQLLRAAGAVLAFAAGTAQATLTTPLHIGATNPIANEFNATLPGHHAAPGALVMVLWASNSVIYPPSVDGTPHALNPAVSNGATAIGRSTAPSENNPGIFSLSLAQPRPASGKVFVRVFNKPTLGESSFYADSAIFTLSGNKEFIAAVGPTTNALDTADDDGDGLHNSWEKSYGSSSSSTDSDGDGLEDGEEHLLGSSPVLEDTDGDRMADGHEQRAGTGPTDPASFLGVAGMEPMAADLRVQWASVTGHLYQVEGAHGLVDTVFSNLSDVVAAETGTITSVILTNALQGAPPLILRVRLVEE